MATLTMRPAVADLKGCADARLAVMEKKTNSSKPAAPCFGPAEPTSSHGPVSETAAEPSPKQDDSASGERQGEPASEQLQDEPAEAPEEPYRERSDRETEELLRVGKWWVLEVREKLQIFLEGLRLSKYLGPIKREGIEKTLDLVQLSDSKFASLMRRVQAKPGHIARLRHKLRRIRQVSAGCAAAGYEHMEGTRWRTRLPQTGRELIIVAAELGDRRAKGKCHYEGWAVDKKDPAEAFKLFFAAAELGDAGAQFSVGTCLLHGIGTEKDETRGLEYLKRSAEKGESSADYALGAYTMEEGKLASGLRLIQKAAEAGDSRAFWDLGNCYYEGRGTVRNADIAIDSWKSSAKQRYPDAPIVLAKVLQDREERETWVRKGLEWALGDLDPDQKRIAEAKKILHMIQNGVVEYCTDEVDSDDEWAGYGQACYDDDEDEDEDEDEDDQYDDNNDGKYGDAGDNSGFDHQDILDYAQLPPGIAEIARHVLQRVSGAQSQHHPNERVHDEVYDSDESL